MAAQYKPPTVDTGSTAAVTAEAARAIAAEALLGEADATHASLTSGAHGLAGLLASKADQASLATHVADTANPHGVSKAQVGLGSTDNTADTAKPVSVAQQAALNFKIDAAEKAAPSGVASLGATSRVVQSPKLHAVDHQPGGTDALAIDAAVATGSLRTLGTGSVQAAQGSVVAAHQANITNPHSVTQAQVGLALVNNTADSSKPISAAQQTALDAKLPLDGGTMTGNLVLAGDPTVALHAATRQYVLAQITSLIAGAPGALDTLNEIASQLATDEGAVTTLTGAVASKLAAASNLADLVNVVTARTNLGLGTAATQSTAAFDASGAATAAQAASQPIDSDLTAIAALATTSFGRSLLTVTDAAAMRTASNALDAAQKAAASGVPSLDSSSRVVQSPKLHATDHAPGGTDALAVDSVAATGSLRTLGMGVTQAAQGSVAAAHQADTSNPHAVTKAQVGLGTVDNTADTAKPVSTAQQTALDLNVPQSLVDAKGDLLVGTADNTVARKAAGSNETALVADSAQTDGLRWAYPRMSLQQRLAMPTGALTEVGVGRYNAMSSQAVLTSGTLRLSGMCVLPKDRVVASITIPSGSTAAVTPTNQWFCLVRVNDLAVLRKTTDDTTTAWGAGSNKTLSLSSSYTPAGDELVYLGVLVVAGTVPTIVGWSINQSVTFIAPITCGNSTTGLTTPASLGATAAVIGSSAPLSHYGYVS